LRPQKAAYPGGFFICGAAMATANNPFDLNTKNPGNLLTSATQGIAAPDPYWIQRRHGRRNRYTDGATTQAYGYSAKYATGTKDWSVDNSNQTVQNQLKGIIEANSPLMQQARTNALQAMNQRGLVNSSMAIGAGQDAVIPQRAAHRTTRRDALRQPREV
jgi:hypothetical protein